MRIQNPQRLFAGAIVAGLLVLSWPALGNDQYPTATGQYSPGQVVECLNQNGSTYACALTDTGPFAVTVTRPGTAPAVNDRASVVAISPNSGSPGPYPTGAIPITNNATGTTGAVTATLAAVSGKTTWICGFSVSPGSATTAIVNTITVAGTKSGSLVWSDGAPATAAGVTGTTITVPFSPCIPASAVNTAITVAQSALSTGGAGVEVNAWGFQQ